MPTPLLISLIAIALIGLALLLPPTRALIARMLTPVGLWLAKRKFVQRMVVRSLRRKAHRAGTDVDEAGRPKSDLGLMLDLAAETDERAALARKQLRNLNPEQRRQVERMLTMSVAAGDDDAAPLKENREQRRARERAEKKAKGGR